MRPLGGTDTITEAQVKYSRAVYTLNCEPSDNLTDEQLRNLQQAIIQADVDVARYEELLRRCCEALGVGIDNVD